MRKITVAAFVSLDGVMEDPGGAEGFKHGGWTFKYPDDEGMKFKFDELMEHDAQLLGRVTYDGFAKAWPDMKDDAGFAEQDGGDILVAGSAQLHHALVERGLVDEWRLMVFPIVLGSGKRLFGETADATGLELVDSRQLASGSLYLTYRAASA